MVIEHDPRPFFEVARRLYKPEAKPTLAHYFVRLLDEKNLLRRHYTQNVDDLERISGLPEDKFIEAHGTFHTGHCCSCKKEYSFEFMKEQIMNKVVPKCSSDKCDGIVKPDIVFFGENLPKRFYNNISQDFSACDLLIIMGTSLTVMPFCGLIHRVGSKVPRLYINREYTGGDTGSGFFSFIMRFMVAGFKKSDLRWGESDNKRDVFVKADADDAVLQLSELLGWKDELLSLKKKHDSILDEKNAESDPKQASQTTNSTS